MHDFSHQVQKILCDKTEIHFEWKCIALFLECSFISEDICVNEVILDESDLF